MSDVRWTKRRALVLLLAAPTLALSACGGGGDEDKIKDILKDIDKNPAAACTHATDKLLAQLGGDKCAENARGYSQDDAKIKGDITVKVNGDKATADFDTTKGQHSHVTFVKDGDEWKVDSVS